MEPRPKDRGSGVAGDLLAHDLIVGYIGAMSLMRWLCERVAGKLPERQIWDREGGSLYLSRYYLLGGPRDLETLDQKGAPTKTTTWKKTPFDVNIMLHKFHRSDDDGALHCHPWKWSFSIILAGGYSEERRVTDYWTLDRAKYHVVRRVKKPLRVNIIRGSDYHRVDLLQKDCWTLFIAGPKVSSWSFWDRDTYEVTPWQEFIARRRNGATRPRREPAA